MPIEERFGASQPPRGYEDVSSPTQHERASPSAPHPVADLVADHGPKDAEHDGIPQVEVSPLDQDACCKEYGLAGQRHPGALEHHSEEDDQVAVLLDEGEDPLHGGSECRPLRRSRWLIHPSAWKMNSQKLVCRMPNSPLAGHPMVCLRLLGSSRSTTICCTYA